MVLRQRNEEVQTLATEAPEEALADRVRGGRPDRRAEDADTHRRDGRIPPWRIDAVAIVEHEAIAMRCGEDLPELLHRPGGGRVGGGVNVEQATAPDLQHKCSAEHL